MASPFANSKTKAPLPKRTFWAVMAGLIVVIVVAAYFNPPRTTSKAGTTVFSPAELPRLVGQRVELKGIVSNTKCPSLQGVDMWELENYRGQTIRAMGVLRADLVTKEQLDAASAKMGVNANRGPGTFYHLDGMKYEVVH